MTATLDRLDPLLERRLEAGDRYFAAESRRLAELCRTMAERFERGGRLLAVGGSPQAWSDARHVAVEFVHPVIVGKRALSALAVEPGAVDLLRRDDDMVISFEPLTVHAGEVWSLEPADDDPFVRQELAETAYHCLWELVHVFFDHLRSSTAGAGASGFLYPFLGSATGELDAVVDDVRASVEMKAAEVADLREQTLTSNREEILEAAADTAPRARRGRNAARVRQRRLRDRRDGRRRRLPGRSAGLGSPARARLDRRPGDPHRGCQRHRPCRLSSRAR